MFWDHRMDWQKIRRDLSWAAGYQLASKLVGYIVLLILIRYLSQHRMGEFFFAVTLATFVAMIGELGTNQHLVRMISAQPEKALDLLSRVVMVRLPFMALAFLLINGFALIFKREIASTILLASIYVLLREWYSSFGAFFVGLRRVGYRVLTALLSQVLLLGGVLFLVAMRAGLSTILWCYIAAHAITIAVSFWVIRSRFGPLEVGWKPGEFREILRGSFPLFMLTFLGLMHFKIDTLMLGLLQPFSAVAVYESAYKFLEASRSLVWPGVMIFFPVCASLAASGAWPALSALSRRLLFIATAMAATATVLVLLTADWVVPALFGARYVDSVPVLRVLFLAAPALFAALVATYLASAMSVERPVVTILLASLALNIGLNAVFIPRWGPMGAAWATLGSEVLLAVGSLAVVWSALRARESRPAAVVAAADLRLSAWSGKGSDG